ncbi:hypothetical protein X975_13933, partial [Stegodyphus mimosarum]
MKYTIKQIQNSSFQVSIFRWRTMLFKICWLWVLLFIHNGKNMHTFMQILYYLISLNIIQDENIWRQQSEK